jgi:hypothetical protein
VVTSRADRLAQALVPALFGLVVVACLAPRPADETAEAGGVGASEPLADGATSGTPTGATDASTLTGYDGGAAAGMDAGGHADATIAIDASATDGSTKDGSPIASSDAGFDRCKGLPGPPMVVARGIASLSGPSLSYCIDSTEVTQAQYAQFLAAKPSLGGQPATCGGNTSYAVDPKCVVPYTPTTTGNYPVVCVNWCDAYMYCLWAGKRLCGRIGGGPNEFTAYTNGTLSQWYAACGEGAGDGGPGRYPYGFLYDAGACNGADKGVNIALPVGSLATCEGSFPGLFDMSGNVEEFEDCCSTTADASISQCRVRGGSYTDPGENFVRCDWNSYFLDVVSDDEVTGFRCCKD